MPLDIPIYSFTKPMVKRIFSEQIVIVLVNLALKFRLHQ